MRTACIAAGLLVSLACSSQAQQQGAQDAAARIGDRTVTVRELDDRWKQEDPAAKAQADQAIYDGRKAALDAIIADALIDQAAKAKGIKQAAFDRGHYRYHGRIKALADAARKGGLQF